MKVCVKAWQKVIDLATGKVHDEVGLRALDAILFGPVREVKELTDDVAKEMVAEFEKLHPYFRYDHLEIHMDECAHSLCDRHSNILIEATLTP